MLHFIWTGLESCLLIFVSLYYGTVGVLSVGTVLIVCDGIRPSAAAAPCILPAWRPTAMPSVPACTLLAKNSPPDCFLNASDPHGFESLFDDKKQINHPIGVVYLFGGEGGIRTLEPLLMVTRFPIVRARPTTRLLRISQRLLYITSAKRSSIFLLFFIKLT